LFKRKRGIMPRFSDEVLDELTEMLEEEE